MHWLNIDFIYVCSNLVTIFMENYDAIPHEKFDSSSKKPNSAVGATKLEYRGMGRIRHHRT